MWEQILVAFDGGDVATKALKTAIEIAKNTSAKIHVISVCDNWIGDSSDGYDINVIESLNNQRVQAVEKIQEKISEEIAEVGVNVNKQVEIGRPGEVICGFAKDIKADLILMGSNNRSALGRIFMGSVSTYVSQNCHCSILIIK